MDHPKKKTIFCLVGWTSRFHLDINRCILFIHIIHIYICTYYVHVNINIYICYMLYVIHKNTHVSI